ncbi:MAG: amidohydrolase [Alphaproteobacteria bacterium]|nr:amidohydrolase [Alphaproteobacteria bacterium]
MLKIDIFNHIFPVKFYDRMLTVAGHLKDMGKRVRQIPMMVDLDERFRVMDRFDEYCQVLSIASPPLEVMAGPDVTPELAKLANDGMAELVTKYPQRFPAFTASLPMNNPDAAVAELHRAIKGLGARGVQLFTNVAGKPLDLPEFQPIFDAMAAYDLPIWLHPARGAEVTDYLSEKRSKYEIWWTLGWPYETSVAMARLVFAKLFDRLPGIKIITHHLGGMIPYFEGRVGPGWDLLGSRTSDEDYTLLLKALKKRPLDYFRMFYADTAVFGSVSATRCGLDFFGIDKVLFASDAPFDPERGPMYIRETIKVLDGLDLSPANRARIYYKNAQQLLRLPGSVVAAAE